MRYIYVFAVYLVYWMLALCFYTFKNKQTNISEAFVEQQLHLELDHTFCNFLY